MATLMPLRALRPTPEAAAQIAAVPYDVVSTDEARALASANPLSFLHVSRAEIDLASDVNPYADDVYARAAANFASLRQSSLVQEDTPSVYVYRLRMATHEQTGLAACYAIEDYDRDVIKKHERTRRDKEDDRTRHLLTLRAQTGPVFLTYRAVDSVDARISRIVTDTPLYDFQAGDGVQHTLWLASSADRDALVAAFARIPALYIADGHHRAASASRARARLHGQGERDADTAGMLAVAFPHNQLQVLAYNRVIKDLNGRTPSAFLDAVRAEFAVTAGSATPSQRGEVAMYVDRAWYTLKPLTTPDPNDAIGSLDVSVLQDRLLAPVLGIKDPRTDKRIDFVGGARGTQELQRLVDSGAAAVAFSLHPVSVSDLMTVSDRGDIMPPKSTWFEPKLRDGLLSHLI